MPEAISYKRFSSPKQGAGDSTRRQTDLAQEYCERHQLTLVETYLDAGLSGFTGQHLGDRGALRALLKAAEAGRFKPGTHLLVESLDRLSRQEISAAVRLFLDILETGLVIVTLGDGEQIFSKEKVDRDPSAIVIAIVFLSRANNESRMRRERAIQAKLAARRKARLFKVPITADCPRWLSLEGNGDARRFIVDEARASVVRQVFDLCVAGLGERRIVSYLNERQVPPVSGYHKWRIGMIGRLLRNAAVIGTFHPTVSVLENGRRQRMADAEGPIEDYYPAIVEKSLFERAQHARQKRLKHHGHRTIPAHTNLVARLGCCVACGGSLFLSQSSDGFSYLRCVNAHDWDCRNRFGFPYRKLEAVLLALDALMELERLVLQRVTAERLAPDTTARSAVDNLDRADDDVWARHADWEDFLIRFKAAQASIGSAHLQQSLLGRRVLVAELRRLFENVVLHPDRLVTIHMKPSASGRRATLIIGYEGLRGIQVKSARGTLGVIAPSAFAGLVRPVQNGISKVGADKQPWQRRDLGELSERLRIVHSPEGDWQAVAHEPLQFTALVSSAERAVGAA